MYDFIVGKEYKRREVQKIINVEPTNFGKWVSGYCKEKNDFFIFANIGIPGETGHDYPNQLEGNFLHWFTAVKTKFTDPQVQELLKPQGIVYIFYRTHPKAPFIFAGIGIPVENNKESPVYIKWKIITNIEHTNNSFQKIEDELNIIVVGKINQTNSNIHQRSQDARKKCLEHYGYGCSVCGFNFEQKYGEHGKNYIHVHHLEQISEKSEEYMIDPITHLRPVCPNCHAMLHRYIPLLSIEELRKIIEVE